MVLKKVIVMQHVVGLIRYIFLSKKKDWEDHPKIVAKHSRPNDDCFDNYNHNQQNILSMGKNIPHIIVGFKKLYKHLLINMALAE
jgi:hypothetical protein